MNKYLSDIRLIFNFPIIYELFQNLVGAENFRSRLINQFIKPSPSTKVLDIGCGPGTMRGHLPEKIDYVGLDFNVKYITRAQNKYRTCSRFYCVDVKDLHRLLRDEKFDIVIAIGLLHHLNNASAMDLIETVYHILKEGGRLITCDCVFIPNQSKIAKYIISKDRGQNVRTCKGYIDLVKKELFFLETFMPTNMLRIPYNHCVMEAIKKSHYRS
jgi:cyclopropane fatty-acyl-phospholipid synthase-like methyltransferase